MFHHYIDIIPFVMASLIIVVGASKVRNSKPITGIVVLTTAVYLVAQSTWFSSWVSGNPWGRDFSNYIWFLFNTCTLGIFAWVLLNSNKSDSE